MPWLSLVKHELFHRTLASDQATLLTVQDEVETKKKKDVSVIVCEHRQNMSIVQATEMTKDSSHPG